MALRKVDICYCQSTDSRWLFFPGDYVDLSSSRFDDINIIAGALKLYFRMLPLPIVTFETYTKFIEAVSKYLIYSLALDISCCLVGFKDLYYSQY